MTKRDPIKTDRQEAVGDEDPSRNATCNEELKFCFPYENLERQDAFRRQHLVDLVCELAIRGDWKKETSPILGLSGSWGSGKSWVAQKALLELESHGFATVSVSAWQRYGAENLALDILQQISCSVNAHFDNAASGGEKLREDIQKSKEQLKTVLRRVARGSVSHVVKLATGADCDFDDVLFTDPPKQDTLVELSGFLVDHEIRLCVVIDDLDRCTSDEILGCLSFMRDLTRLGSRLILCCFDREGLERQLERNDGARFVEKIIPMIIPLESPEYEARYAFLKQEIDRLLLATNRCEAVSSEPEAWAKTLRQVASVCQTPRDLIRVAARFVTHYLVVRGEENIYAPHLLCMSALHELIPALWAYLRDHPDWFDMAGRLGDEEDKRDFEESIDKLLHASDCVELDRDQVAVLVLPLYYDISTGVVPESHVLSSTIWRSNGRAFYFQFREKITEIARAEFREVILTAPKSTHPTRFLRDKFGQWHGDGKSASLLNHLEGSLRLIHNPIIAESLFKAIMIELQDVNLERDLTAPASQAMVISVSNMILQRSEGPEKWKSIWEEILPELRHPDGCIPLLSVIGDRREALGSLPKKQIPNDLRQPSPEQLDTLERDTMARMLELIRGMTLEDWKKTDTSRVEAWFFRLGIDAALSVLLEMKTDDPWPLYAEQIVKVLNSANYRDRERPPQWQWEHKHQAQLFELKKKWKGHGFGGWFAARAQHLLKELIQASPAMPSDVVPPPPDSAT